MVYDDASTVPPALTIATLLALRRSFGSLVAFRRGTTALGFGAANHEAIRATNAMYILLVNTGECRCLDPHLDPTHLSKQAIHEAIRASILLWSTMEYVT